MKLPFNLAVKAEARGPAVLDGSPWRGANRTPASRILGLALALALVPVAVACAGGTAPVDRVPPVAGTPEGGPAKPDEPGWRVLLIAGDVSSPVFNNAVSSFRDRLVALGMPTSHVRTVRSGATHQSATLEQKDLARRFSFLRAPSAEGCLLFITSHGVQDGLLIETANGSMVLTPTTLGQLLSATCGGKPTVAILSGCYSGVYLDRLPAIDNQVLLTASRHDRTSFGCSHSGELNFFDACLLSAMEDDPTWTELFRETRDCVTAREQDADFRASLPQAHVGASLVGMRLSDIL